MAKTQRSGGISECYSRFPLWMLEYADPKDYKAPEKGIEPFSMPGGKHPAGCCQPSISGPFFMHSALYLLEFPTPAGAVCEFDDQLVDRILEVETGEGFDADRKAATEFFERIMGCLKIGAALADAEKKLEPYFEAIRKRVEKEIARSLA